MSRFGGRFVPNIEHEVRKQAVEPVVKWRQEWVLPANTSSIGGNEAASSSTSAASGVKILKWVKVEGETVSFPEEQDVLAEDRVQDDAAIVEAPVQSIHNAPAAPATTVATPAADSGSIVGGGGLGTIAPVDPPTSATAAASGTETASTEVAPASAIPAHVTQSFSEPTTGTNTTGENTPTDSIANTPAASAVTSTEDSAPAGTAAALIQEAAAPQVFTAAPVSSGADSAIEPQVEAQLHEQPPANTMDDATLAVLAGKAEAEQQPATETTDVTAIAADPATTVPAAQTETEGVPAQGDVEMNDA